MFDLIQSELFARPNDVFVNIRLVELFRSSKRLDEAVIHCLKPDRRVLRTHLEWCSCVVQVLKVFTFLVSLLFLFDILCVFVSNASYCMC